MIPKDKLYHLITGAGIASWLIVIFFFYPVANHHRIIWVAVLAFGVGKELIWDLSWGKGQFDLMDIVATLAGGSIAMIGG
jgi:hypothetical protein